jgi:hypothetical protein
MTLGEADSWFRRRIVLRRERRVSGFDVLGREKSGVWECAEKIF